MKTRSLKAVAAVFAVAALAPLSLFAEDSYIEFKGQRIYYQNATPAEIEDVSFAGRLYQFFQETKEREGGRVLRL